MCQKSNLVMLHVLHPSLLNCRMLLLVGFQSHRLPHIVIEVLFESYTYNPSRPLYACGNHSNVQNSGTELFNHGIQSKCPIPRWDQIWRLSGYNYWYLDVHVLLVHFKGEGLSFVQTAKGSIET